MHGSCYGTGIYRGCTSVQSTISSPWEVEARDSHEPAHERSHRNTAVLQLSVAEPGEGRLRAQISKAQWVPDLEARLVRSALPEKQQRHCQAQVCARALAVPLIELSAVCGSTRGAAYSLSAADMRTICRAEWAMSGAWKPRAA